MRKLETIEEVLKLAEHLEDISPANGNISVGVYDLNFNDLYKFAAQERLTVEYKGDLNEARVRWEVNKKVTFILWSEKLKTEEVENGTF